MNATSPEVLSLFDNVIGMQLDEVEGRICQGMKVIKLRDSAFTPTVTRLVIPNSLPDPFNESRRLVTDDPGQS
jgi:circadian clock protein KaiC